MIRTDMRRKRKYEVLLFVVISTALALFGCRLKISQLNEIDTIKNTSLHEALLDSLNVTELYLGLSDEENEIVTTVSDRIKNLKNLKKLSIHCGNLVDSLPSQIGELPIESLTLLWYDKNFFPSFISRMTSLKELIIKHPLQGHVSSSWFSIKDLQSIRIYADSIVIPSVSLQLGSSIENISLYGKTIKLPNDLTFLRNVKSLSIETISLDKELESINHLPSLEKLYLSVDSIRFGSSVEIKLPCLKELYVKNKAVEWFAESKIQITNVEKLIISGSDSVNVSKVISKCPKSKELGLINCALVQIDVSEMNSLKHLDLSSNRFTVIPKSILSLSKLEVLILNSNKINYYVAEILKMKKLKELHLLDNPMNKEVLRKNKELKNKIIIIGLD